MTERHRCPVCHKAAPRETTQHRKIRWEPTGRMKEVEVKPGMTRTEPEYGRVIVPYEGNLQIIKEDELAVTLWDGESYSFGFPMPFCSKKCALEYAQDAYKRDPRRLSFSLD